MGKRGPKPKPTLLNVLDGNPSRRKRDASEPQCDYYPVKQPLVSSDAVASAEWDRLKMVTPPKLYTAMDEGVLAQYCLAWSRFTAAEIEMQNRGLLIETPIYNKDGDHIGDKLELNPAHTAWAKANDVLFKTGDRLGLSPSTRARINMPSREEFKSRFAGLLGQQTAKAA